ncbi:gluconate 2-dehydrogenase subunit 3 family protein, partial [Lysobacter sp. 2RAB21]
PGKNAEWKPLFLTQAQAALVAEVAEIMIPRTDTPGAKDVGIAAFIDKMLKDVYPKDDQARFVAGLADFETQAKREHGRAFLELEPALRAAIKAAHARKRLAVVHVSLEEEAALAIDAGADGLVHINGDRIDDPKLIAAIKRNKAFVVPTLSVMASVASAGEG